MSDIGRNDPCWCGSGKKWKQCHFPMKNPASVDFTQLRTEYWKKYGIRLKTPEQIAGIRAACALAVKILEETCKLAKVGVTTLELNDFAHEMTLKAGALPAPLGYGHPPFPKSICTSLNEVICHGIPDKVALKEGDILNIDVSPILNNYFGDCSKMVIVGEITPEKKRVVDASYDCLQQAVKNLKPGLPISVIGNAIEDCAAKYNCSVVNQFVGHGVGIEFHENPQVPHHRNKNSILLVPGMTFTIEPMINLGVREGIVDPKDQWTTRTKDGKASAQFEYTILITDTGHEILTPWVR